jgi:hypothetical protein
MQPRGVYPKKDHFGSGGHRQPSSSFASTSTRMWVACSLRWVIWCNGAPPFHFTHNRNQTSTTTPLEPRNHGPTAPLSFTRTIAAIRWPSVTRSADHWALPATSASSNTCVWVYSLTKKTSSSATASPDPEVPVQNILPHPCGRSYWLPS